MATLLNYIHRYVASSTGKLIVVVFYQSFMLLDDSLFSISMNIVAVMQSQNGFVRNEDLLRTFQPISSRHRKLAKSFRCCVAGSCKVIANTECSGFWPTLRVSTVSSFPSCSRVYQRLYAGFLLLSLCFAL